MGFLSTTKTNIVEEQAKKKALVMMLENMCKEKTPISYNKIMCINNIQHKHSHYSESSLIKKLKICKSKTVNICNVCEYNHGSQVCSEANVKDEICNYGFCFGERCHE